MSTGAEHDMNERFLAAYDTHADGLFRFVSFKLSDREMALDLVQETFTRLWDTMRSGTVVENEKAFLFTIARRLVIDRYRARRASSLDALQEEYGFDPIDEIESPPERLAEQKEAVALIRKLPETYQEVLLLRYVEGLEPRDIARVVGDSANAVTVRLHRGLEKLRTLMHENTP